MNFEWYMVAVGCIGGAIPDAMRIAQKRYEPELPSYVWSANFWLGFGLLIALGGLASIVGGASDWKHALAMGYAAPEVLSRAFATPPITLSHKSLLAKQRRWWAF